MGERRVDIGSTRYSLEATGLLIERRGRRGTWIGVGSVPYAEIRLLYRYPARDWSGAWVALIIWLLIAALLALGAAVGWWPWTAALLGGGVLALGCGAGGAVFVARPTVRLQIEGYRRLLLVPETAVAFFPDLAARVASPPAGPAAAEGEPALPELPAASPADQSSSGKSDAA